VFGHLLGLGSLDGLEKPLAHKQASLPITLGGIRLILTSIIALVTYLESWTFVTSIIAARFMVNQHPFFLETLV
jgi:hypothetical protein